MDIWLVGIALTLMTIWIGYRTLLRPVSQITFDDGWTVIASNEGQVVKATGRIFITTLASGVVRSKATCKVIQGNKWVELDLVRWVTHALYPNTRIAEFEAHTTSGLEPGKQITLEVYVELADGARKRMKQSIMLALAPQSKPGSNEQLPS